LARTEEVLMEYREKVNIAEDKAQKLTENHHQSKKQFDLVVEHLRGEIQSLKELLAKQNEEHNLALTKSTKPSPTKVRISVRLGYKIINLALKSIRLGN
jgi:hypothetical protein